MKTYLVTIPIAGHVEIEVEADSESSAIETAFEHDLAIEGEVSWDLLDRFQEGNVCYCPSPWIITAEEV